MKGHPAVVAVKPMARHMPHVKGIALIHLKIDKSDLISPDLKRSSRTPTASR
jgi:hypothetical protein